MRKIPNLLQRIAESLGVLALSVVLAVLFFMWFPDFIVWYSGKMGSLEKTVILEVIPLFVAVSGMVVITMLVGISAFHLRKPEMQGENA